ncbi:3-deoxy-manno-octulosonate cytidylyltransferase [Phaeocystidibacter marisrubri]|uniref:3-deoxy-manno-octulosonate cytidylyltransferase n=1 Tax=Phaeocystidibacter marisrubri TaxID=1577780 RepID=A0A6L3ZI43_9FLAO|nr:3-deoxy-manno-octulosonate cytidylyltransferase [Phaeocystidibacter marisrubri]KAB2817531.1 3-deoxy-manno-octulosonate cytidylyltransferase [Phaeocystidibacter marisrubri]GGH74874.1 3-deoxy-manno-octulosonate cytidylyltransferase [Phaeocystidibacter marisrubri]
MKTLGIIPARYDSTRFPGKPLVDLEGKTMIRRVYERASQGVDVAVVATDDARIESEVKRFGGNVVMTAKHHSTGTNRCLEAFDIWTEKSGDTYDIIVNVQGDEPLLDPASLRTIIQPFTDMECEMATLVTHVTNAADLESSNNVFVTLDQNGKALYFSRHPIPFVRGYDRSEWLKRADFYRHIGLYAFRPCALRSFASMAMGELEKAESLEQLRWLESGRALYCGIVNEISVSVDTPEDADAVRALLNL